MYGKCWTTRISTNIFGVGLGVAIGNNDVAIWSFGKIELSQILVVHHGANLDFGNFHIFTGGDRNQRSASARGCLFRGREEDKEECRADSQLCTFVQDMYRLLQFGSVSEFGLPTRGCPLACLDPLSTLGVTNFQVKPVYPSLLI